MRSAGAALLALAMLAGAATVFGFAPFGLSALPIVTLSLLVALWQSAPSARAAAAVGFAFGAGLFGAGASWVYIALNTYGGMPLPLAGIATAGFCAFLALYPAAAGWLATRWTAQGSWQRALAAAAAWTLAEWARSVVFTGFPWLSLGYAALPGAARSAWAGYAPIGGVFLVTLAMALAAAALALATDAVAAGARRRAVVLAGAIALIAAAGAGLARIGWTEPAGPPVAISLVQGNVPQDVKFDRDFLQTNFRIYADLVAASHGRLVVLPESAFPVFRDEVPDWVMQEIAATMAARGGDALVGVFTVLPALVAGGEPRYYNSVVSAGTASSQIYRKRHLVPFGETIPLEPVVGWILRRVLAIPLASQARGDPDPPAFVVAGVRVAVDICYEDAFGSDIRPQAKDAALLVNVTNDAWYGRSLAAEQHNQIAAMRALETGRPMLRATNTGITSAIGADGRELARLPWFTRGILEIDVAGRRGSTPYLHWGDAVACALAAILLVVAIASGRRSAREAT